MDYQDYLHVSKLSRMAGLLALVVLATASEAALYTTHGNAPTVAVSWADAIWQPGPSAPIPGNSYEILRGGLLQAPTADPSIFPGDSLVVDRGARLRFQGTSLVTLSFPGVHGKAGLVLNGGRLQVGDDNMFTINGQIILAADSLVDLGRGSRSLVITAQLSGEGNLTVRGGPGNSLDIQSTNNPYTGNWKVVRSYLRGASDGSLGTGDIMINHGTLEISYDIQTPGSLTLLGADSVMVLHQDCQFSAVTVNGAELEPGTYSYADLAAQFPGNFAEAGTGSITVTAPISDPEPTSMGDVTPIGTADGPAADDLATRSRVKAGPSAPLAPTSLTVSVDSSSQITINWSQTTNHSASAAMAYRVYRGKTLVGATSGTSYTDSGLAAGARYCYKIVAFDDAGKNSPASRQVCAKTPQTGPPPIAPTDLSVVGVTATSITLQWQNNSDNETGFQIQRATQAAGPWSLVGSTGSNVLSYTDSTVVPSTAYFYQVSAMN